MKYALSSARSGKKDLPKGTFPLLHFHCCYMAEGKFFFMKSASTMKM